MSEQEMPQICDYEGASYRADFWEGGERDYEDLAERIALRRLLPERGGRLLEVGAGFGRLTNEFKGYDEVILLDYSRSQLEFARQQYGDEGYKYVAANIYAMPFAPGLFEAATMVRVLHHMQQPDVALRAVRETLRADALFVLEYANKQNLKAILRWVLRQQDWSPFDEAPVEFVALNYDFHPRFVAQQLTAAGFDAGRKLTVSHFRIGLLKKMIPAPVLARLDGMAALTGDLWQLSPSVFVKNRAVGPTPQAPDGAFWKCPTCAAFDMTEHADSVVCGSCGRVWGIANGVYNFKEPKEATL
jgi:SAM-dependent methyltransferase